MNEATRIKVRRDGPRGWHWIAAENYDPAVHVLYEAEPVAPEPVTEQPEPKRRGRPPKSPT